MPSLVTGATGFVGQHLVNKLDKAVVVGRNIRRLHTLFHGKKVYQWDHSARLEPSVFSGIDTVYHLAGESVSKGRWNTRKKERILRSRVDGTRLLVESLAQLEERPTTLICASAIGYYGDRGETILTETSKPGKDFLAHVCVEWEKEAAKAEELGIRVVKVRTGIVLGPDGGALPQMLTPFRLGVGGKIGSGKQFMSWIHIDDLIGIMLYAADNPSIRGPVNTVSPNAVTNAVFTKTLAKILFRPAFFHVPGSVLKITLGEFANALLSSQRVVPEKILASGYDFAFSDLATALKDLI